MPMSTAEDQPEWWRTGGGLYWNLEELPLGKKSSRVVITLHTDGEWRRTGSPLIGTRRRAHLMGPGGPEGGLAGWGRDCRCRNGVCGGGLLRWWQWWRLTTAAAAGGGRR